MVYRRQRSSTVTGVHPTHTKIVEHARAVLAEDGFDRFQVQRVLDSAQVSRGTLYHHFPDVDALIEEALVETFREEVARNLALVIELVDSSPDRAAFRDALRTIVDALSTMPAGIRLRRAHTVALASTRPELAAAVASVQDALTDGWDDILQRAQHQGLVRAELDTRAAAVTIQAIGVGRIVDDAASTHLDNERWADSFFEIVDRVILNTDA